MLIESPKFNIFDKWLQGQTKEVKETIYGLEVEDRIYLKSVSQKMTDKDLEEIETLVTRYIELNNAMDAPAMGTALVHVENNIRSLIEKIRGRE